MRKESKEEGDAWQRGCKRSRTQMGRARKEQRLSLWLSNLAGPSGVGLRHRGKSPGPPKLSLHTHSAHPPPLPPLSKAYFLSLLPLVREWLVEPPGLQTPSTERKRESRAGAETVALLWDICPGFGQFALTAQA